MPPLPLNAEEKRVQKINFSCLDMNAVAKSLSLREEMLRVGLFIFFCFNNKQSQNVFYCFKYFHNFIFTVLSRCLHCPFPNHAPSYSKSYL